MDIVGFFLIQCPCLELSQGKSEGIWTSMFSQSPPAPQCQNITGKSGCVPANTFWLSSANSDWYAMCHHIKLHEIVLYGLNCFPGTIFSNPSVWLQKSNCIPSAKLVNSLQLHKIATDKYITSTSITPYASCWIVCSVFSVHLLVTIIYSHLPSGKLLDLEPILLPHVTFPSHVTHLHSSFTPCDSFAQSCGSFAYFFHSMWLICTIIRFICIVLSLHVTHLHSHVAHLHSSFTPCDSFA